uniref:Sialin n=1 Tax=Timema shepardi TaxID=629360 RepID=A0A7R9AQI1_TIMSH|nr:unnamed protein product [Timema shepardi]
MTASKGVNKVLIRPQQKAAQELSSTVDVYIVPGAEDTKAVELNTTSALVNYATEAEVLKARYVFALMGFLGASILYFVRVNISVAIVAMVNHTALASERTTVETSSEDVCPGGETNATSAKSEDGEFKWDEELQGIILSGFFYGYAAGQLLGGQLAERFGGKIVYGLGTFIAAALTVVSPQCAWISDKLLFAVRLLEGLAESVTYPALQFMISKWAPPQERSRFSIIFSGGYLGTITCFPISGLLCDWGVAGGWPMVFYVFGGLGVVWFIPWLFLVYDTPQQHPRISKEERDYIQTSIGTVPTKKALATPWKELLLSPGLWACAVMYMGIGWTFFTLLTGLPTYMKHVLHFNIKSNALLSTIPYITGGVFSVILGYLMDYIIAEGCVTKLTACKICNAITSIGPAVTLLLITVIGCNPVWIIVLLAINGLCMGTQYTGNSMNLIALAPNFAGTTYGLCNTFSSSVGILAPYVTGFLTKNNQTRTQWNLVFYTSAAVSVITFIFYMALCTDEEQPWNNPHPDIGGVETILEKPLLSPPNWDSNHYLPVIDSIVLNECEALDCEATKLANVLVVMSSTAEDGDIEVRILVGPTESGRGDKIPVARALGRARPGFETFSSSSIDTLRFLFFEGSEKLLIRVMEKGPNKIICPRALSGPRRSAVARLRKSVLTVTPSQVVYERVDLLFEYRVIVMTLNLANELVYQMKGTR